MAVGANEEEAMTAAKEAQRAQTQLGGKGIKKVICAPGRILNVIAK